MDKNLTKEEIKKILTGTFKGNKIQAFGITHYHYDDCEEKDLVETNLENVRVHKKCKLAFDKMQRDALKDSIRLEIISGYRSSKYQIEIFKCKFKDKNKPTENELKKRLSVSAPSGFSEHHTGLAIDINSVEDDFAGTPEALWLEKNAPKYGFELSFPKDNKQGLSYEPWHWRYIGDNECRDIFILQI
jgi:D-alanyl-D-alanine carboxypeptidase